VKKLFFSSSRRFVPSESASRGKAGIHTFEMINDFYKTLPQKRVSAGALIFNKKGKIIFVKPNYKDHWSIPGGIGERDESPRQTCIRETKEEIGLDISNMKFLCVDYVPAFDEKIEALQFIFDGGVLDDKIINIVKLQKKELDEWKFMSFDEASPLLSERLRRRIPKCVEVLKNKSPVYLENGKDI
jgi:8-oxo-dGTP diphosphatase